MHKLFSVLLTVVLLLAIDVSAQSVVVGNGQFVTSTNLYGPMRSNTTADHWNRHAYVYPSSLLSGLTHGANITSIEFNKNDLRDMVGGETVKIYIKNIAAPDWGAGTLDWATAITGASLVFDGAPQASVAGDPGFKKFIFSAPFTFDTTNGLNIAILVDYYQLTAQTGSLQWRYDNAAGVPGYTINQGKYVSGTGGTPSTALATSNERHPQVKINFPVAVNMAASGLLNPTPLSIISGTTMVKARYINEGLNPVSGAPAGVKIFDGSMMMVYDQSTTLGSVTANQSVDITFTDFTPTTSGIYTVKSFVKAAGDLYPADDTLTTTFQAHIPTFPMVVCFSRATANERSNADSVIAALTTLGVVYDSLNRDLGVPDFSGWRTVVWCEEGSIQLGEIQALKNFLDGGTVGVQKSLLIAGDDIAYFHARTASASYDSVFAYNYLRALYFLDDGNGTPDQSRICGAAVNNGLCDSLSSTFPDGIGVVNGSVVAYRFDDLPATSDTVISVAYDGPTFNVLFHAFEFREIVTPVTEDVSRIMGGSFTWIESVGGIVPVELISFTSIVKDNDVTLNWKTATETNNSGFAIERKSGQKEFSQVAFVPGRGTTTEPVIYSYTDLDLNSGTYTYRLKQIDLDGTFSYVGTTEVDVIPPKVYALEQNYPNPFNPATTIKYSVPVNGFVNLGIYNLLGEKIADLINKEIEAGSYEINFDASNLSSGVYFYKLEAGSFTSIKKMMLIK